MIFSPSSKREISTQKAIEIAKTRDIDDFIECSVRREENVERTFEALTILMLTD